MPGRYRLSIRMYFPNRNAKPERTRSNMTTFQANSCLGTSIVKVNSLAQLDGEQEGLLAVFTCCRPDVDVGEERSVDGETHNDAPLDLFLELEPERLAYWGNIYGSDLKGVNVSERKKTLDRIVQSLLKPWGANEDISSITVSYALAKERDQQSETLPSFIQVSIKELIGSKVGKDFGNSEAVAPAAVVKILWKGELQLYANHNDVSTASSSIMQAPSLHPPPLAQMLGATVNQIHRRLVLLKQENQILRKAGAEWKQTTNSLEKECQRRQNELLENFLVLLNRAKADLRNVRSELQEEKAKRRKTESTLEERPSALHTSRQQLIDHEDEHDIEAYDTRMVACLAAGVPVGNTKSHHSTSSALQNNGSKHENNRKVKTEVVTSGSSVVMNSSKRKNPVSGAIEMWGTHALFQELEETDDKKEGDNDNKASKSDVKK